MLITLTCVKEDFNLEKVVYCHQDWDTGTNHSTDWDFDKQRDAEEREEGQQHRQRLR